MTTLLPALIFSGSVCPLYAFALFLPTIINQVSVEINRAFVPYSFEYSLDTVLLPPTCSPSQSTFSLVPQLAQLGSTATAREGAVCLSRMYFLPQVEVPSIDFPSTSFCIGAHDFRWYRSNSLISRSRCWIHNLDCFQDPCIIVFRCVRCRVVSLACLLEVVV